MKKLPLCESSGCVAKIKKCTDTCLAAHGCPDELHDYFQAPIEMIEELRKQFKPVPVEPCADFKWSKHEIHEITDAAFRQALDKRLSSPSIINAEMFARINDPANRVLVTVDYVHNDPIVEVDATNHLSQSKAAAKMPCLACNDNGIVDGEFDGALKCTCKKGTNHCA